MLLLDTDVMIDLIRQYPLATAWLAAQGTEEVVLPGFVVLELIQGCRNKVEQDRVEQTVAHCRVVWPTEVECHAAVHTYAQYHLSHNLGCIDALIGHTALLLNEPLYTFNQKHYSVIPGLKTLQPYTRTSV